MCVSWIGAALLTAVSYGTFAAGTHTVNEVMQCTSLKNNSEASQLAWNPCDDKEPEGMVLLQVSASVGQKPHNITGGVHASVKADRSSDGKGELVTDWIEDEEELTEEEEDREELAHELDTMEDGETFMKNPASRRRHQWGFKSAKPESAPFLIGFVFLIVLWAPEIFKSSRKTRSIAITVEPSTESWTGIRAVLSFWIFCRHAGVHCLPGSGMFFILSGAILSLVEKNDLTTIGGYFQFLARRLIRVLPAYWVLMAFNLSGKKAYYHPMRVVWTMLKMPYDHPKHFFATQSWDPNANHDMYWFVSTVLALYCMFPFVSLALSYIGTRKSPSLAILVASVNYAIVVAIAVAVTKLDPAHKGEDNIYERVVFGHIISLRCYPFCCLPQFIFGMCVAHLMQGLSSSGSSADAQDNDDNHGWRGVPLAFATDFAAILLACFAVWARFLPRNHYHSSKTAMFYFRVNIEGPIFALLLFGLAQSRICSYTRWLFTLPWMIEMGQWSYGVYLWHPYILGVSHCEAIRQMAPVCTSWGLLTVYCVTLLAAGLSFHLVEEPCGKLMRRFVQLVTKPTESTTATVAKLEGAIAGAKGEHLKMPQK